MRKIEAWQATDGTLFPTEHECVNYEWVKEGEAFEAWYSPNNDFDIPAMRMHCWLQDNAEDIRRFLQPVAAKPELDIKDWLAGEFQ